MSEQTSHSELDPAQRQRSYDLRVARIALIVTSVVVVTGIGLALLWRLRVVVLLIVVSLFLGALLHPLVSFVQRRGVRRGSATALVFFVSSAVAASVIYLLVHPVYTSATNFAKELPTIVRQAQHGKGQVGHLVFPSSPRELREEERPSVGDLDHRARPARPRHRQDRHERRRRPRHRRSADLLHSLGDAAHGAGRAQLDAAGAAAKGRKILGDVSHAVAGYMLGNLATSTIAGMVIFGTLRATDVPYAGVLAIWVGVVDFLPLVGGLLAGVPTVAVALLHSLPAGIVTLAAFLIYQQIENHVLNPVVMSRTVRLNPLWVLLAILIGVELGGLIGSTFGGLVGALLAVPAASAIQVVARDLWAEHHSSPAEETVSS